MNANALTDNVVFVGGEVIAVLAGLGLAVLIVYSVVYSLLWLADQAKYARRRAKARQ